MNFLSRRSDRERWSAHTPGALVVGAAPNNTASRVAFGDLALGSTIARRCPEARVFFGPHYTMPMRLSLPAVVTVHDLTILEHPEWHEPLKAWYFRAPSGGRRRDAEGIICVSDRTGRQPATTLQRAWPGVRRSRTASTIAASPNEAPPGTDAAVLSRLVGVRALRLHVGTVEPRKNLPGLISAFDLVAGGLERIVAGARRRVSLGRRPRCAPCARRGALALPTHRRSRLRRARRPAVALAPRLGGRLPVIRRGVRIAGPRSAGVRRSARHLARHCDVGRRSGRGDPRRPLASGLDRRRLCPRRSPGERQPSPGAPPGWRSPAATHGSAQPRIMSRRLSRQVTRFGAGRRCRARLSHRGIRFCRQLADPTPRVGRGRGPRARRRHRHHRRRRPWPTSPTGRAQDAIYHLAAFTHVGQSWEAPGGDLPGQRHRNPRPTRSGAPPRFAAAGSAGQLGRGLRTGRWSTAHRGGSAPSGHPMRGQQGGMPSTSVCKPSSGGGSR